MSRALPVVSTVLLVFALSGCTALAGAAGDRAQPIDLVPNAEAGSDLGNDRPQVSYDGLMVRRRVVVAVHPTPGASVSALRAELEVAAARHKLSLSDISPNVLDPILLEHLVPELIVALPALATLADAGDLVDTAFSAGESTPGVDHLHVESVLVHDLRFTVPSTDSVTLVAAIDREGILSDALGSYESLPGGGGLEITYTGPLLSDELVRSVRVGIARGANTRPGDVAISPRSDTGVGVDMATEPAPASAVIEVAADHDHPAALRDGDLAAALPSPPGYWGVAGIAAAVLLALGSVALIRLRRSERDAEKIVERVRDDEQREDS